MLKNLSRLFQSPPRSESLARSILRGALFCRRPRLDAARLRGSCRGKVFRRTPWCIVPCGSSPRPPPRCRSSLKQGDAELSRHPLLSLLARPNAREGGQRFLESLYGHLMVSGNAYVEAVSIDGAPREFYALRPDRMRVVPGADGWPAAYDYTVGTQNIRFAQTRRRRCRRSCI